MRKFYGFVGSRDFKDLSLVAQAVKRLLADGTKPDDITVVSGGARGVDREAEWAAFEAGMRTVSYRPRQDEKTGLYLIEVWENGRLSHQDGRIFSKFATAAFFRNGLIVNSVQELYVFWDGTSTGTLDAKQKAHKRGIPVHITVQEPADARA